MKVLKEKEYKTIALHNISILCNISLKNEYNILCI